MSSDCSVTLVYLDCQTLIKDWSVNHFLINQKHNWFLNIKRSLIWPYVFTWFDFTNSHLRFLHLSLLVPQRQTYTEGLRCTIFALTVTLSQFVTPGLFFTNSLLPLREYLPNCDSVPTYSMTLTHDISSKPVTMERDREYERRRKTERLFLPRNDLRWRYENLKSRKSWNSLYS